jgi:hypothetical protein
MKLSKIILLLSSLTISIGATASERLYLQVPVQYAPSAFVIPRIKSECDLEREMASNAEAGITKRYGPVAVATKDEDLGNEKVIKLTITSVDAIGGAQWTGPKSMTVLAELKQGENVLGSKVFSRSSGHSGLFGGTCDMLHKVTRALGADVGVWLKRGAAAGPAEVIEKTTDDPV